MAQVAPVTDDEGGIARQIFGDIRRRTEARDNLDPAVCQARGSLGQAIGHEGEVSQVRVGICVIYAERAEHGLTEFVGPSDRVFERGIVRLSLALLHPVKNILAVRIDR